MRRVRAVNPHQPVVGSAEVAALLGWDARKVAVYARRGALPAPLAWLTCGPVWGREDILRWAVERGMAAGTPEGQVPPRDGEPPSPPSDALTKPVRFVSRYGGLTLFGGPRGTVRFAGGQYVTADPVEIAWLRRHPSHGIDFHEAGRA